MAHLRFFGSKGEGSDGRRQHAMTKCITAKRVFSELELGTSVAGDSKVFISAVGGTIS